MDVIFVGLLGRFGRIVPNDILLRLQLFVIHVPQSKTIRIMVIQRARLVTILSPSWEIVQRNTAFFAYSVRLFITPDTDQTSMNAARWSTSAL